MRTVRSHSRLAGFVGAMVLLILFAPAMAAKPDDHNRPVEVHLRQVGDHVSPDGRLLGRRPRQCLRRRGP